MKIVDPENVDFKYSKNFLRIRFFGSGLKWFSQIHYLKIGLPDFRISDKILKSHKNISDKNEKKLFLIFWDEKNISRLTFENLVSQFLDDMLLKICAHF